jgi:transcription elongation factor S-II
MDLEPRRAKALTVYTRIFTEHAQGQVPSDAIALLAKKLEQHVYRFTIETAKEKKVPRYWQNDDFVSIYRTKALSMSFNLNNPSNPQLCAKMLAGEIKPSQLVQMSHREMFPGVWAEVESKIQRKEYLRLKHSNQEVPEGLLQCSRCRSKRVIWYMSQCRSADESSSIFATCSECNKKWKFNP